MKKFQRYYRESKPRPSGLQCSASTNWTTASLCEQKFKLFLASGPDGDTRLVSSAGCFTPEKQLQFLIEQEVGRTQEPIWTVLRRDKSFLPAWNITTFTWSLCPQSIHCDIINWTIADAWPNSQLYPLAFNLTKYFTPSHARAGTDVRWSY